jgi:hypothetical protein
MIKQFAYGTVGVARNLTWIGMIGIFLEKQPPQLDQYQAKGQTRSS